MIRTFQGWIDFYEKKAGEKWNPPEGCLFLFDPPHGIMAYHIDRNLDALYVDNLSGDARYWYREVLKIARDQGVSRIKMFTRRDPRVFIRRHMKEFGLRVTGVEFEIDARR